MPGRLIVRRIPDFNAAKHRAAGQDTLFDVLNRPGMSGDSLCCELCWLQGFWL